MSSWLEHRRLLLSVSFVSALSFGSIFLSRAAAAQTSATCRRIQAEADSRAALLLYPTVHVQGVRLPSEGDEDGTGLLDGDRWQARAMVSVSPLDIVRGVKTLDTADAACLRHDAQNRLQESLELGLDLGKRQALERQISHLRTAMPRLKTLVQQSEQRLAEGLITFLELNQLRLEVMRTERRLLHLRGELELLNERNLPESAAPLPSLVATYESRSMDVERKTSSLRRLQPWQVSVRGGVIPDREVDYFGIVELSYNMGDLAQGSAERGYLEARQAELSSSRSELRQRAERLRRQLATSVHQLDSDLRMIDEQLDMLRRQKHLLVEKEAPGQQQALALLEVQMVPLESERVYVQTLLSARQAYRENA